MESLIRLGIVATLSAVAGWFAVTYRVAEKGGKESIATANATEEPRKCATTDMDDDDPDVRLFKDAKLETDDAKLIAYLRQHSKHDDDLLHVDRLIQQLGAKNADERDAASAQLQELSLAAVYSLEQAIENGDPKARDRALQCLVRIKQDTQVNRPLAAVRILARHKAEGAVVALLQYLPYAADENVEEVIYYALESMALQRDRVHPALIEALGSELAPRRAVAGCLVGRLGDAKQRRRVRDLLDDKNTLVRLRTAQGLLAAEEECAVPTFISLLNADELSIAWQAEELLHWIGGDASPREVVGAGSPTSRHRCQEAWNVWYSGKKDAVDLKKVKKQDRLPILFLVCSSFDRSPIDGKNRVFTCGCDGKMRWELSGLCAPMHAQLLGHNRVLIAENGIRGTSNDKPMVSERDLEGNVTWKYTELPVGVTHAWRHPNGDFLIYCKTVFQRVSRSYKEIYILNIQDLLANVWADEARLARRRLLYSQGVLEAPNGHIVLGSPGGVSLSDIDPKRGTDTLKDAKIEISPLREATSLAATCLLGMGGTGAGPYSATVCGVYQHFGSNKLILPLSDGGCLVALPHYDLIARLDFRRAVLWLAKADNVQYPVCAMPHGGALFMCTSEGRLILREVDVSGHPLRAYPAWQWEPQSAPCLRLVRFGFDGNGR